MAVVPPENTLNIHGLHGIIIATYQSELGGEAHTRDSKPNFKTQRVDPFFDDGILRSRIFKHS